MYKKKIIINKWNNFTYVIKIRKKIYINFSLFVINSKLNRILNVNKNMDSKSKNKSKYIKIKIVLKCFLSLSLIYSEIRKIRKYALS